MGCMMCLNDKKPTRNINLYVIGSEGFDACQSCEMQVVDFVNRMRNFAAEARKQGWIKNNRERAKTNNQ